jgi:OmcA/MtrC family decaheme c-type cytochrome
MRTRSVSCRTAFLAIGVLALILSGCGKDGSDGAPGPQGEQGVAGEPGLDGPACVTTATALTITVDKVTMFDDPATMVVEAIPVVDFTVRNESGIAFCAFTDGDLRFNIAKLTPAMNGNPSVWQNYITGASTGGGSPGEQHASQERFGRTYGKLESHLNGHYTYTFATDLMNAPCPSPCTDADGNALDLSYQETYTHRIGIQMGGSREVFPLVNATYDFVPDGSTVTVERDIVQTANCNECHNRLRIHGSRIETKFCVTCHNPGSWLAKGRTFNGVTLPANETVDFKVFIHKLHRSEDLHQLVDSGQKYLGFEFPFPQDIRNCTKCHTDSDSDASRNTPQGGHWNTDPSVQACSSCHDDVYFTSAGGDPDRPWQTLPHPGGLVSGSGSQNAICANGCHTNGLNPPGSIASSHTIPDKVWRAKFKYNILEICGVAVDSNPVCTPGSTVTVKFSVEDPTGGTHGYGAGNSLYNIKSDPEFTSSAAALNMDFAWATSDYNNTDNGATGSALPARAAQVNLRTSADVTDDGAGIFTLGAGAGIVIPDGTGLNGYSASGSGTVGMEGHPAADFNGDGTYSDRASPDSEVAFFGITDTEPVARRAVVDMKTKCDNCHDVFEFHGGNRNNNAQICVLCHNPNNTDVSQRPKTAIADPANPQPGEGLPDASVTPDGKKEESIDFKRLIHAIHGNEIREKGIVVYGYGGSLHEFGEVEFPGIVSDCHTCHLDDPADTMTLEDRSGVGGANWEQPAQNGILGSTIDSAPNATVGGIATGPGSLSYEQALRGDDLKISPTAAVCSSCHDDAVTQAHMENLGSALFGADPATVGANIEQCVVCHGPDTLGDVEVVHHEATERAKQGL